MRYNLSLPQRLEHPEKNKVKDASELEMLAQQVCIMEVVLDRVDIHKYIQILKTKCKFDWTMAALALSYFFKLERSHMI
jgi:hypothetical protein